MAKLESMEELLDLFWQAVTDNVPPSVSVRKGWRNNPDWSYDEDVIFLRTEEVSGEDITQPFDSEWLDSGEDLLLSQGATRLVRLHVTGYGPRVYNYIAILRNRFYGGVWGLRRARIYVVPEPSTIVYTGEEFQSRWWPRTDLTMQFNVLTIFEKEVPAIKVINVTTAANGAGEKVIEDKITIVRKD